MEPAAVEKMVRELATSGVNPAVVYILAVFMAAVVLYLLRDHVKNHARLIVAFERNTKVFRRVEKHLKKSEFARTGRDGVPGNPSSTVRRSTNAQNINSIPAGVR